MGDDLSSASFVSSISSASSIHQPKPPGGPKPTSQRFAHSSKASGKVVRSPYLASTPFPDDRRKSRKTSSVGGHSQNRAVPEVWASPPPPPPVPNRPHPSISTYLQSLMKVLFLLDCAKCASRTCRYALPLGLLCANVVAEFHEILPDVLFLLDCWTVCANCASRIS